MEGSSFAQGDHAFQLWKSFTCANADDAGAAIVIDRTMRKSDGLVATMMTNATTMTARAIRILISIKLFWPYGSAYAAATCAASFSRLCVQPARTILC